MIPSLKTLLFREPEMAYTGRELSPHWIFKTFDLQGDALVAFRGPADVPLDHMVDLEDVKKKAHISSISMLHFIGEWFLDSFDEGILLQHLFVREIFETLLQRRIENLTRSGDDIFFQKRKLSVSIATKSPVSVLMHTALNIRTEQTPIPCSGLAELSIEPFEFAQEIFDSFARDIEKWKSARTKVLPR